MADFAGIPGRTGQRPAPDHQAGADAALSPEADEVIGATPRSAQMLGGSREIGVIAYEHRDIQLGESIADEIPHRHVSPAEVRGVVEMPVEGTDGARNRYADRYDGWFPTCPLKHRCDEVVEFVDDLGRIRLRKWPIVSCEADHRGAETDDRGPDPVSRQVDCQCGRPIGLQLDNRRGSAWSLGDDLARTPFLYQPTSDELADKRGDRAAVQTEATGKLGAGHWPAQVELTQHAAQIPASNLGLGDAVFAPDNHMPSFLVGRE
jgi:hypothetical protein